MKLKVASVVAFALGVLLSSWFFQWYQISDYQIRRVPSLAFADGSAYVGDLNEEGLMHGAGRLQWVDGSYYQGEFKAGMIQGKGSWFVPDDYTYQGEVEKGYFNGQGEIKYNNGDQYLGQFELGEMQGQGSYQTSKGDIYTGTFLRGKFTGQGRYEESTGISYEGGFKDWRPHGKGIKIDAKGNQWQGEFNSGLLSGEGEYIGVDGERYTGTFLQGLYHGQGTLSKANGDIYTGGFNYGSRHGEGEMTLAEPVDGISHYKGQWKYGQLVKGDESFKVYSATEIAEFALYNQSELLEKALANMAAQDPGKIDLYVMGVAGYGSEEVFRREINFVEQKMHELYHVGQRSLYLSNSRRSLNDRPMATVTSIEKGLLKISEVMDKDQDILLLFMTSHGSENRTFSLNQKGLSLADLSAEKLGRVLDQTGIKYKVIILSACYSGGFINDLKDEHTLVITAAAANQRSFGCADDNLFTYFGEAYFKQSLKPAVSFTAAFENARELVNKWETEQGTSHSEPQISRAPKLEQYLKKWRQQL